MQGNSRKVADLISAYTDFCLFQTNHIPKLVRYLELLHEWNTVYNLTAIRTFEASVVLHLLDSLSIQEFLQGPRIIDVGSGGGLPGIPLAIVLPQHTFTLIDTQHKKTRFLTHTIYELELKNVTVITHDVMHYTPESPFNTVVARAWTSLHDMIQKTEHLLEKRGVWLAMKGQYPTEELACLDPHKIHTAVHKVMIPGYPQHRHVVCAKHAL